MSNHEEAFGKVLVQTKVILTSVLHFTLINVPGNLTNHNCLLLFRTTINSNEGSCKCGWVH